MVHTWNLASHIRPWVEGLRKLLGDRASSSLTGVTHQDGLEQNTTKSLEVNAGMLVETHILGGHRGMDEIRRDLFVGDIGSVLDVEGGENLTVRSDHLGRQFVVRVLQILEGRNVGEGPDKEYHKEKEQYRKRDQNPEPLGDFLSCRIGHNKDKFKTKFGKLPSLWLTLQIEMANYL